MDFEITQILPIYDNENKVVRTNINFKPNYNSVMVLEFDKDLTNESTEAINEILLDKIYNDWFPNKAENEKFKTVDDTILMNRKALSDMIINFSKVDSKLDELAKHTNYEFKN